MESENSDDLTIEKLLDLVDPKNPPLLKKLGGPEELAKKLGSNIEKGLSSSQFDKQIEKYGTNKLPEAVLKTFLQFVWEAAQDKTLMVLMVAAALEIGIGIYKQWFAAKRDSLALIDGGAIVIAILVVIMIGAVSDYRKQSQFKALSEFGKSLNNIAVFRDGELIDLGVEQLIVGDIINVQTGVVVPADAVLISGFNVSCDESAMTGEPHAIEKEPHEDAFLLSGTNVVNGIGKALVICVGVNSLNGRSLLALEVEQEDTPLQQKLNKLADMIANIAFTLAVSMIVILAITYFAVNGGVSDGVKISGDLLTLFILAVTVVVVAVPEGLPLAVTLSLAHATLQMLKDNNLVRHLSACETMGNATTICSDKTGTLTLNKMTVVESILMEVKFEKDKQAEFSQKIQSVSSLHTKILALVGNSLNVNSTASESKNKDGEVALTGSKTEIALLEFWQKMGYSYQKDRETTEVVNVIPFSSDRKRMTCVVKYPLDNETAVAMGLPESNTPKREFIYVKGASEIVLRCCTHVLSKDGKIIPMTPELHQWYENLIASYADEALRTICCAIKPIAPGQSGVEADGTIVDDKDLVLAMLFGILDPLRPEVPAAVARCQRAGVVVRMVTGDSEPTARAIARGCGILTAGGLVMEGPKFRKLTEAQLDEILPKLQVLARSSPLDKQILVNNLKRLGETVAVTGDGTNDAPALASADVGFSMGIAGTEVAKEASDIILMDDNFASLVKAVLWGRCVYDAIRKFLQFQLTVNVSAVCITVISALHTTVTGYKKPESILTAIQLLWVNLIMDTMAALALATDNPTDELLNRMPSPRSEPMISPPMFKQIMGQALFQIVACLSLYFLGPTIVPFDPTRDETVPSGKIMASLVFNTFIFCQIFNEINSRSITSTGILF
jgi:Ca2+-transporting ATPase